MRRALKWFGVVLLVAIVAIVVAWWTPDTDGAAMRAKYRLANSQFVDVGGGLTVHLVDEGPRNAPVLVLLHGSNSDLHTWDPWAARLGKTYRVIRFDQIGHGLTGANPTRDYSMRAFTDTVEAVTRKLGISHFVLAGSSMGGGVAWNYAVAHPGRLDALILVDASGAPELAKQDLPLAFRLARTPGARELMLHLTPRSLIAQGLHKSFGNQALVTDAMIDRYWELLRYPGNRQATLDRFTTPRVATDPARLKTIAVPTLILWGGADKLLPVAGADWFARTIPGAKRIVYPGVGHLPMEEVADRSTADVRAFLAKIR